MPKCCVCKLGVFKIKAPGLQCSGSCREFYHFRKCSHLTDNEVELIEKQRLTWQCKNCKKKRTSLVFSRTESATEPEHESSKAYYEKVISNQEIMMRDLTALTKLVESCVTRINLNSSKIESALSRKNDDTVKAKPALRRVVENRLMSSPVESLNEIQVDNSDSEFEDAIEIITEAQVHREDYGMSNRASSDNRATKITTQHRKKKQKRKKPVHRDKMSRLIVKPTALQTSDKTKTDLRNKVITSVPISGVRNASNGGVIIACKNADEIQALQKEAHDNLGAEYEVRLLEKHNPKILIVGMSTLIDKDSLSEKLKSQNSFLKDSTVSVLKVQQSTKSKYFNAVVELDNQSYRKAIHFKKVFIDWERCFVYDNVYVVKCYKCCGFNHKTDVCKNEQSCSKCAQQHLFKECTSSYSMCINCKTANEKFKMNLDVNHPSWDKQCSVYLRKIQLEKKKTNYNN